MKVRERRTLEREILDQSTHDAKGKMGHCGMGRGLCERRGGQWYYRWRGGEEINYTQLLENDIGKQIIVYAYLKFVTYMYMYRSACMRICVCMCVHVFLKDVISFVYCLRCHICWTPGL